MSSAVRVQNVSKRYRLRQGNAAAYRTLREEITSSFTRFFRRSQRPTETDFWALRDVEFALERGETLGIIGRNGAGKSTLLKILSRITRPTSGSVRIAGRVGTLLEVGTGFHPELTGKENIFLSGATLGMKRQEIARRFDAIVEFAEVDRFLDLPVKRYSSGMYVRLAFSVAAHLETDVLIVDEVLAVGDAAFQAKCIGKMESLAGQGRTILFVTHNIGSVRNICKRAILLNEGRLIADGKPSEVIETYSRVGRDFPGDRRWDADTAPGTHRVKLRAVEVHCKDEVTADVLIDSDIHINCEYDVLEADTVLTPGICVRDVAGTVVFATLSWPSANLTTDEWYGKPLPIGRYRSTCVIPGNLLNNCQYVVDVQINGQGHACELLEQRAISFIVHDTGAMRAEYGGEWLGLIRPRLAWTTSRVSLS